MRYIHVNNSGMNDYQAFVIQRPRSSLDTAIDKLSMVDKRHQLLHPSRLPTNIAAVSLAWSSCTLPLIGILVEPSLPSACGPLLVRFWSSGFKNLPVPDTTNSDVLCAIRPPFHSYVVIFNRLLSTKDALLRAIPPSNLGFSLVL